MVDSLEVVKMDDEKQRDESAGPSPELIDHASRPRNLGPLEHPDAVGEASRSCGDAIEFSIVVRDGRILGVGYLPRSCLVTLACASMASTMVLEKTPIEARRALRPERIIEAFGGLPKGEEHCATLVSRALWAALDDYIATEREPWKRVYRSKY